MAILLKPGMKVIVQGATGIEGSKALKLMQAYGTNAVAGVTPGKGGETIVGIPIYNTVREALKKDPDISVSAVYVPPLKVLAAVMEACEAKIPLIVIVTEKVPIKDIVECIAKAKRRNVRIIGPSSVGIMVPGIGRIGAIGGEDPERVYSPGPIGLISRSGGMTNEIAWNLKKAGLGQSTAVSIGGDYIIGTSYRELLTMFNADAQTKGVVIFGEVGGIYEFEIARMLRKGEFTKPLAIYLGGRFAKSLPEGVSFGHTGAIIEGGRGIVEEKEKLLEAAGALVARWYDDLPKIIREACNL